MLTNVVRRLIHTSATASILFVLASCGTNNPARSHSAGYGSAFVFMTDYMSAAVGVFRPDSNSVDVLPLAGVHTDVALRSYGGLVYVLERFGKDAITVIDPALPTAPTANYSTGNGSNPQDIIVADAHRAYVLRLNTSNVLIINPQTGDSLGTIDLASYADPADGRPEMAAGVLESGTLYVLLQLLDTASNPWLWPPTGFGKVVAIDTRTNAVTNAFTLTVNTLWRWPCTMARFSWPVARTTTSAQPELTGYLYPEVRRPALWTALPSGGDQPHWRCANRTTPRGYWFRKPGPRLPCIG